MLQLMFVADITAREVLPLWIAPDAVGGKLAHAGDSDWGLNPSSASGTLGQLGSALKAATQAPRFFRSIPQWMGPSYFQECTALLCHPSSVSRGHGI